MTQWRLRTSAELEQQVAELQKELGQAQRENEAIKQQCQILKAQNDRLLKMEAQHQSAKTSLIKKRIVLSKAVILVPENMVIGDRLENSVIKIYRGTTLTVSDTAELINCRIIGLPDYADGRNGKLTRTVGSIEIKGLFYNNDPKRFSIMTHERVVLHRGVRFRGNVCAGSIVIPDLTKVRGKFASRDLWEQRRHEREAMRIASNILESGLQMEIEKSNLAKPVRP